MLSGFHFFIFACLFIITLMIGMKRFDNPDMQKTIIEKIVVNAMLVLGAPLVSPLFLFKTVKLSNTLQWILTFSNSLLWGLVLFMILLYIKRRILKNKKQPNQSYQSDSGQSCDLSKD